MKKLTQTILTFAMFALCAMLAGGCTSKARMARHQARADAYFASGDYSKAEVEYLIALRLDRANAHAISQLGEIYYLQGRFYPAYEYISKACQVQTNNLDMHAKLGLIYVMGHKPKEAKAEAEFVLGQSPTNAEAPDILAESVSSRAEVDEAQKRLEKLSKQIGDTAPLELAFGILAFDRGDAKGAEAALQRALTINPKYSLAYNSLGRLYMAQNKMKEADAAFKKTAELAPPRSSGRLAYANFKIETGDIAEGKRLMAEISKETPDYVPAWIQQAEIAMMEKKFPDCSSLLDQALARDPDDYQALLLRGRLLLLEGHADDAAAEMDHMSTLYPHSAQALYYLAAAHVAMRDTTKAKADLNRALFLQPKYGDAIILLAGLNISSGDTGQAISALKQVIKDQPGMTQAYLLLGTACTAQKNFDQALAAYSKLAELNPKNAQAPLLMGTVLLQKKDTAGARREFEKALQLSPSFLLAEESLVNLDIREEKFTSALDRLNKETDQKLGAGREILLAKVYINRAESVARKEAHSNAPDIKLTSPVVQDDVNHAEAALQKAIALEPMQDVPYLILAQLYISAGKQQVALEHLNSFVAKTNDAAAFMEMGSIYEKMKDFPKARDAYEKVIALKPGFGGALNNLAYLYATRLDDVDKGYPLAEKAYQASPTASTADTLGWILVKKGEYPRARALLEDSASKLSGNPEVQLHLGMVRYMMGDEGPARAALQEAANSTEDFPSKDEAAKALAILAIDPKTADAKVQADLEKTLQDEPNDPVAATRLAGIYEREGNLDKAQTTYEQLIKQNPQNGPVLGRLAGIYLRLNQIDRAMDTAKQAHKLSPNDPSISSVLGRIAFKTGDYNFAATLLQEAAPRLTGRPEVQYDLAWSYYSLGRVNDAERTMQGAAPTLTGARQADAQLFLTLVAAAQTPTAAATARAAQVLGTNADYVPAIMISAMEAEKQAKPDDAMRLYGKALARYPSFLPAARNLAILAAQHPGGDDQNAYDAGMKARAVYSDDVNLERALGLLAYRRADYPRAVQLLTETSQTLNNDGEVFFYLGMAQYQMKHLPQSKVALQRALALDPKSKSADDARKVLAELK